MTKSNHQTRKLPERFPKTKTERISDELNPEFLFSGTHADLLVQIANGIIKTKKLAKKELQRRGLDRNGLFVGYKKDEIER